MHFFSKSFGTKKEKVIFFFTAFLTRSWMYYFTIEKLTKAGYHVIVYDVNPTIVFNANIADYLLEVKALIKDVQKNMKNLKQQGAKTFFSFGTSMGTIFAMRSAIEIPEIKKVILNTTYGSLADHIWSWNVLKGVKKRLENDGLSKKEIDILLAPISPIPMAAKLKDKKILLYLARKDNTIEFNQSLQFKKALDEAKVEYVYYQSNTFRSHFFNYMINNLRSKRYLEFLKH